jgi:hypothetical protein
VHNSGVGLGGGGSGGGDDDDDKAYSMVRANTKTNIQMQNT